MRERSQVEGWEGFRPLLFSIAYRMVGEVGDAEDVVQEAFLRAHRAALAGTTVRDAKAFLCEITTRLAIDHLRSARVRRERYVGPWLPEPLLTDAEPDPAERMEVAESLSMAFLVVLETLSPVERAVFLLHDVFGFGFEEVAKVVDKTPDNVRQIAVRARGHIEARRPRFGAPEAQREALASRFFDAVERGDIGGLVSMLADDVVMTGDGRGRGARRTPARGALQVARFLAGLGRAAERQGLSSEQTWVNGQPGAVTYGPDGRAVAVMALDILDGRIVQIQAVVDPAKLVNVPARTMT